MKTASTIAVAALALGLCGMTASTADAANRYALTKIENPLSVPIKYQFRWGENGEWQTVTLEPRSWRTHWWTYDYPDQNASPKLYVRFDSDMTEGFYLQEYWLVSYAVPDTTPNRGKVYAFQWDGYSGRYIDLKFFN
jgi:hypothetical protein